MTSQRLIKLVFLALLSLLVICEGETQQKGDLREDDIEFIGEAVTGSYDSYMKTDQPGEIPDLTKDQPKSDNSQEKQESINGQEEPSLKSNVLKLTDENFKSTVRVLPAVFVNFYAPWCGMCKKFNSAWNHLGLKFQKKGMNVTFAKMNAEKHIRTASIHDITGYPTLMLFWHSEQKFTYEGPYEETNIDKFLTRILVEPTPEIPNIVEKIKVSDKIAILITNTRKGGEFEAYQFAARRNPHLDFFTAKDTPELRELTKNKPGNIFIFKRRAREVIPYVGELLASHIRQFFAEHRFDLILSGDKLESIDRIFEPKSPVALIGLFQNEDSMEFRMFNDFAREIGNKGKILFYVTRPSLEENSFADLVGLTQNNQVVLVKGKSNYNLERYLLLRPISKHNLKEFISHFFSGKLTEYKRCQTLGYGPWRYPAQPLTSKTFSKAFSNSEVNALIVIHPSYCSECDQVFKELEFFAKEGIATLYSIDHTLNDLPSLSLTLSFENPPSLSLRALLKGSPLSQMVPFHGVVRKEAVVEWLRKIAIRQGKRVVQGVKRSQKGGERVSRQDVSLGGFFNQAFVKAYEDVQKIKSMKKQQVQHIYEQWAKTVDK